MRAVVAYASKYGFTKGIAEFIAEKIQQNGVEAVALEADKVKSPTDYDAFVIGSAVFFGKWMKEAREFIIHNRELLAHRYVWLFSSGPVGTDTIDKHGRPTLEANVPKDIEEFKRIINPRDHQVFFGGFDASTHGFGLKLLMKSEAIRASMPSGDFRNWNLIGSWATGIAHTLEAQKGG